MPETFEKNQPSAPTGLRSELDFASITELADAMRARKISASELLGHTLARIETLDHRFNAVVVRDFDRGSSSPGCSS